MGGILGNKTWMMSNGGLWVPNVFGMPETVYGWCGCGEEEPSCECDCENCAPVNGDYINNAPCCWKVVIAGIAVTDPQQCADCDDLNRTYYLSQDPETPCLWKSTACECGETAITLEISESNGQYAITVTLGGHVWLKTYDAPPDCCAIAEELTHQSSAGECDSSSATCEISAAHDGDCRGYYCMEVALSGIGRYNGDCGCPSCSTLNGSWKLPIGSFSNYGSLIGTTGYGRDLCLSSEPYHRCGYAHISGSVVIESNEATTATVVVRMYGLDPYAGLPDREEGGMFMQWSGTATLASGQTWEEALALGTSLSYHSQSGKGEFDCDGSSASIVVKVFPYTPECAGECEPGSPCWSRPATCKTTLKCYGDEWPERVTVVFDDDAFVPYLPAGKEDLWNLTPIAGATLTYHDSMTDHPEIGNFGEHIANDCEWSYLSELFQSAGQIVIPGYYKAIWDIQCEWLYFMSAFNRYTGDWGDDDWNVSITILARIFYRYRYLHHDVTGECHPLFRSSFNGPQVRPCNGEILLDCFFADGPLSLEYHESEPVFGSWSCGPIFGTVTQELPIPDFPWELGGGGATIEAG